LGAELARKNARSMNGEYWRLLGIVAPIFLLLAIGFAVRKARLLTAEADASLLRVVINVLTPCLILQAMLGNPALRRTENILVPPLCGFISVLAGFALGLLAARLIGLRDGKKARTFAFAVGLFNYSYIPVPLVQTLFTRETVGVLFTFNLGVEIALWTAGVLLLTGGLSRDGLLKIFNAPVGAIIAGLALNSCGAHEWLPAFLLQAIHMLAQTAVPVALVVTGATVADFLRNSREDAGIAVSLGGAILRLGLLPVLFLFAAWLLPFGSELKRVFIVQAAMPAAMLPAVAARHYGGDTAVALRVVLVTTLLGLVTIPFWLRFGMKLLGQ
jgi:predicted permease